MGLHVRLPTYHDSLGLPFYESHLRSRVVLTLWGSTALIDHFNAWFYLKCVQRCLDDMIDCANPKPLAMRILCLLISSMVLQDLDSRLNSFQEGKDDMILIGNNL